MFIVCVSQLGCWKSASENTYYRNFVEAGQRKDFICVRPTLKRKEQTHTSLCCLHPLLVWPGVHPLYTQMWSDAVPLQRAEPLVQIQYNLWEQDKCWSTDTSWAVLMLLHKASTFSPNNNSTLQLVCTTRSRVILLHNSLSLNVSL